MNWIASADFPTDPLPSRQTLNSLCKRLMEMVSVRDEHQHKGYSADALSKQDCAVCAMCDVHSREQSRHTHMHCNMNTRTRLTIVQPPPDLPPIESESRVCCSTVTRLSAVDTTDQPLRACPVIDQNTVVYSRAKKERLPCCD